MSTRSKSKKIRPAKEENLLEKIRDAIDKGFFKDTRHSSQRADERGIILPDVLEILSTGHHEKAKDQYRPEFNSWNYAIRGRTLDDDELRIAVYFEGPIVMIATVIRL